MNKINKDLYKKIALIIIIISTILGSICFGGLSSFEKPNILNRDEKKAISNPDCDGDVIRCGEYELAKGIGIANSDDEITTGEKARDEMLAYIQKVFNYFLSLIGFFALIYLIYNGYGALTSMGNEEKFKSSLKSLKYGGIAIGGIGLSRLAISLIFRVINQGTGFG